MAKLQKHPGRCCVLAALVCRHLGRPPTLVDYPIALPYAVYAVIVSPRLSEVLPMKPETVEKLQYGTIGLFLGLALPAAIGFGVGLWVTKGAAERMANEAVLTARAKICVAQFTNAPNYQERLKEYKALDYSGRGAFIEKGGWGKMPGEEKASDAVKESCARGLEVLMEK